MRKSKKIMTILGSILVFVIAVTLLLPAMTSSAQEVIYEEKNPTFEKFKVYDGRMTILTEWYEPEGKLIPYDENEDCYAIQTNAFCMWEKEDNIAYAFNEYSLDYADQSKITVETKVLSHESVNSSHVMHENASIGICMREADDMSSKEIYLHCRTNRVQLVFRQRTGGETVYCGENASIPITGYPVYLKMERSGNAIRCSAKVGDGGSWKSFPTQYINLGDSIVAGMASHGMWKDKPIISKFTDYNVTIEGPEGATYTPPGQGEEDKVYENPLPEDPVVTDDILFRETFTDGSLTNKSEDGKPHVDNPIWTDQYSIDGSIVNATLEDDGVNRFWHRNFSADTYFFPNNKWTDYSMSVDMKFGAETVLTGDNAVDLYVRFHASRDTGYLGYRFAFTRGETITLYKIGGRRNPQMTAKKMAAVSYNYLEYDWRTWEVIAFDDTLTLYRIENDGTKTEILSFTDPGSENTDGSNFGVNGVGGIGIGSNGADLYLDNIVVRKLEDLLGEDWDNRIGGNWNDPIPDYIKNYKYNFVE